MKQTYSHTLARTQGTYELSIAGKFSYDMTRYLQDYSRLQKIQVATEKRVKRKLKKKRRSVNKLCREPHYEVPASIKHATTCPNPDPKFQDVFPKVLLKNTHCSKRPFGSETTPSPTREAETQPMSFVIRRFAVDSAELKQQKSLLGRKGIVAFIGKTDSGSNQEKFLALPENRIENLGRTQYSVDSQTKKAMTRHRLRYNFTELTKGPSGEYYTKKFIPNKVLKLFELAI